jgi:hypothetical protein
VVLRHPSTPEQAGCPIIASTGIQPHPIRIRPMPPVLRLRETGWAPQRRTLPNNLLSMASTATA